MPPPLPPPSPPPPLTPPPAAQSQAAPALATLPLLPLLPQLLQHALLSTNNVEEDLITQGLHAVKKALSVLRTTITIQNVTRPPPLRASLFERGFIFCERSL